MRFDSIMVRGAVVIGLTILSKLGWGSESRVAADQPIPPAALESFLDGWMSDAMSRQHVVGAAVSVVQGGHTVLLKGYGFADIDSGRAVDPERTLFRLGSITKTMTWVLVMREVEAGRMSLDKPVNEYLPEKLRIPSDGQSQPVLLRHLLEHRSGFESRDARLIEHDPLKVRSLSDYLAQERPRRVRPPGEVVTYCTYCVALAGAAVANVRGEPIEEIFEKDLAQPLDMPSTMLREIRPNRPGLPQAMAPELAARMSKAYGWNGVAYVERRYPLLGQIAPGGAGTSTARDMSHYMLMHLALGSWNGSAYLQPQTATGFRIGTPGTPPGVNGWAHGFMTMDLPAGAKGYGHFGGAAPYSARMVLVPELDLGIFVSVNSEGGFGVIFEMPEALVRNFYGGRPSSPRAGSPALLAARKVFEGTYLNDGRPYGGLEGFIGRLLGEESVKVTDDGRLLVGAGPGVRAWVPEGNVAEGRFVSMIGEDHIAFHFADGRAVSYSPSINAGLMERLSPLMTRAVLSQLAAPVAILAVAMVLGWILPMQRAQTSASQDRILRLLRIQSILWLLAFGFFAYWFSNADPALPNWGSLVTASTFALLAALLTFAALASAPGIWRSAPSGLRARVSQVGITLIVFVYSAFSLLLAVWGGLLPWQR